MSSEVSSSTSFPDSSFLDTRGLILFQLCLLLVAELGPMSSFVARKMVHACSGLMMLHLNPSDWEARYFVYAVVVSSLAMVWQPKSINLRILKLSKPVRFRYAQPRDIGVTVYLCIVATFFYFQVPLSVIRPVFFADPAGAVVGKALTKYLGPKNNPVWKQGSKTIGGSAAVCIAAYFSLSLSSTTKPPGGGGGYHTLERASLAMTVMMAEAASKDYDNLLIFLVVFGAWLVKG